eukprot:TRINITY_DN1064_c0_g1_i1.p1 TRINITY_DN1064_c0_g1~~TRINITY_DN1064_c0_g1_i1.p1  ORF type:complete len:308 (-),score=61.40 TRINITY_DN1064_c0_g1_i1:863-1786(-)
MEALKKMFKGSGHSANEENEVNITVVGATALENTEWFSKQDPYVNIYYMKEQIHKTKTAKDQGIHPTWDDKFTLKLEPGNYELDVAVWNKNVLHSDEEIGSTRINFEKLMQSGYEDYTADLYYKDEKRGHMRLLFEYPYVKNRSSATSGGAYGTQGQGYGATGATGTGTGYGTSGGGATGYGTSGATGTGYGQETGGYGQEAGRYQQTGGGLGGATGQGYGEGYNQGGVTSGGGYGTSQTGGYSGTGGVTGEGGYGQEGGRYAQTQGSEYGSGLQGTTGEYGSGLGGIGEEHHGKHHHHKHAQGDYQ